MSPRGRSLPERCRGPHDAASPMRHGARRRLDGLALVAICATCAFFGATPAVASPPATVLAWRLPGGSLQHTAPLPATVPLGSVWKLFVYGYLAGQGAQEPPYRCERAQRETGDEYCCDPGESLGRDAALQRSCAAYFEPRRLGLAEADWQAWWAARGAPGWLQSLSAMKPDTRVPPEHLLDALQRVPDAARLAAREALLPNTLRDPELLAALGSSPRFKTWSWFDAQGERWGGAAGWLADGAPFWFGAPGAGRAALQRDAAALGSTWQQSGQLDGAPDAATLAAQTCVDVRFFARYPLAQVQRHGVAAPATAGPLSSQARYTLRFANGQAMQIPGQPALLLGGTPQVPRLQARLPLEDYVARVVDREGDARETAAARALAIAARTWLRQNASADGGCLAVDDDSRAQRVSPRPPTAAARAAAAFTQGLVLTGAPVQYRTEGSSPQRMGWRETVAAGRAGRSFEALLRSAFPTAALAGWRDDSDCRLLPQAAAWLAERATRWQRTLRAEAGFEAPEQWPQVCELGQGVPHADTRRDRIFVREWQTREGRVTLIHEYLHLAFRRHPNGRDEGFVERLAQRLADS